VYFSSLFAATKVYSTRC